MFEIRWLWRNLKGKRPQFIIGMLLSILTSTMMVFIPMLTSYLIDDVIVGGKTEQLVPILAAMCLVQLARTGLRYFMIYNFEIASQHTIITLRQSIFNTIINQELKFYDTNRTGDIITRVTGDMEYIRHCVAQVFYTFTDSVSLFLATVVYLSTVNLGLTAIMIAVLPIIGISSIIYSKKVRSYYGDLRERLSKMNVAAQENIAGNRVVKAFAREDYEIERFDKCSKEYRKASMKAAYKWQTFFPVLDLIGNMLTVIAVLCGGIFVMKGSLTAGGLAAFLSLTGCLANPMRNFGNILNDMQRFFASATKVIEIFYSKPTIADRHDCIDKSERMLGRITFEDVSFAYKKDLVLKNLSFTIEPGETVAIMGPTGSGKTTLINLIARLYDVTSGKVLVDDVDVRMWKLSKLRGSIGMATQDVFLFSDTVDGNISYGDVSLSEEKVREFARTAAADDFIQKLENGYDTVIGERGVGLSGGQRQRIALARALAISPPILILDDTTSAVDMETEHYLQESLANLEFPCTKILIAQRISSVRYADRIFVLNEGELDIGTHDELIKSNSYYREICQLQNIELPDAGGEA